MKEHLDLAFRMSWMLFFLSSLVMIIYVVKLLISFFVGDPNARGLSWRKFMEVILN